MDIKETLLISEKVFQHLVKLISTKRTDSNSRFCIMILDLEAQKMFTFGHMVSERCFLLQQSLGSGCMVTPTCSKKKPELYNRAFLWQCIIHMYIGRYGSETGLDP